MRYGFIKHWTKDLLTLRFDGRSKGCTANQELGQVRGTKRLLIMQERNYILIFCINATYRRICKRVHWEEDAFARHMHQFGSSRLRRLTKTSTGRENSSCLEFSKRIVSLTTASRSGMDPSRTYQIAMMGCTVHIDMYPVQCSTAFTNPIGGRSGSGLHCR